MTTPLILAPNGQLGSAFVDLLGKNCNSLSRSDVDFTEIDLLISKIKDLKPSVIINCAAYTQVDKAESEQELAENLNSKLPKALATYCSENECFLIHFSTDYVYNGTGESPRAETAETNPLSVYGRTKLEGDQAIKNSGCSHLILRTSWVYNDTGRNFVNTMLHLFQEKEELSVVNDQIGALSYAPEIAHAAWGAFENQGQGLYHLCNSGNGSWYEVAQLMIEYHKSNDIKVMTRTLNPISTSEYPTPAKRPLNSRLDTTKLKTDFGIVLPHWKESLKNCLEKKWKL